jgi:uncharacterized membrane protein YdjX (TVP38/TMEM64 family)
MEFLLSLIQLSHYNYPYMTPILFIIIHITLAIFFMPCSPMAFIAGALWGGFYGSLICLIAALSSEAITFLLSRSLIKKRIENFLLFRYPKMLKMINQVQYHDWQLILLVQLNPLVPASSMGYAFGLFKISFTKYILFSGIFMLPLTFLFVMTGSSLMALLASGQLWQLILLLILAMIIINFIVKVIYKKISNLFGVENGT